MNTWLNASVYFLACFLSFSKRGTGQAPGSYQMQELLGLGSSWAAGAWRLISYVLAVVLNLSQVSAFGSYCRLTEHVAWPSVTTCSVLNCWCSWALPFNIDSGSTFLPPNFSFWTDGAKNWLQIFSPAQAKLSNILKNYLLNLRESEAPLPLQWTCGEPSATLTDTSKLQIFISLANWIFYF